MTRCSQRIRKREAVGDVVVTGHSSESLSIVVNIKVIERQLWLHMTVTDCTVSTDYYIQISVLF